MAQNQANQLYSLIVALYPSEEHHSPNENGVALGEDWRLGEITVDWVDFTREKSLDQHPHREMPSSGSRNNKLQSSGSASGSGSGLGASVGGKPGAGGRVVPGSLPTTSKTSPNPAQGSIGSPSRPPGHGSTAEALSLQPLLGHFPGPNPLDTSCASGLSELGRGVIHLFKHAPPPSLISSLDSHPVGEGSRSAAKLEDEGGWAGDKAEGEDGSLIAILAVPAWMRPADFLEFIGGWATCLEGVRMIREATTPNRSIVLLKFRDPLQASDFLVIFTGRAFSTLDARETCHPIRIHHLILHKLEPENGRGGGGPSSESSFRIAVPAFPPSVYASRARQFPKLLKGVDSDKLYELPSCPVCLERLDSTVTGLVTLPCAHTFDCDCLRKWGDSRCPVCRLSHLLLSSSSSASSPMTSMKHASLFPDRRTNRDDTATVTRLTKCSMCDSTENNWICVVCGVVGCGRYEPQKGHARRHWEESGHVLAMELETQRVWDYKGDNYVHRLIQTRNDGKLVELPSASSLVTPSIPRPLPLGPQSQTPSPQHSRVPSGARQHSTAIEGAEEHNAPSQGNHVNGERNSTSNRDSGAATSSPNHEAGPSSNDIDKMSTIESITLEYSYILSSQLESMRRHYESQQSDLLERVSTLEKLNKTTQARIQQLQECEKEREKAEKKADKALSITRSLQTSLASEKALSEGLSQRIKVLESSKNDLLGKLAAKTEECQGLEETVRDLMFSLEARLKMQEAGGEGGEGGDLMVVPTAGPPTTNGNKGKKKSRK
ncbi:BRCA1-associated protein [Kwoniella heveanensis CBS 569]|nr:BRCA1-associated protein [Kwoniella heveanensis CBS 569]